MSSFFQLKQSSPIINQAGAKLHYCIITENINILTWTSIPDLSLINRNIKNKQDSITDKETLIPILAYKKEAGPVHAFFNIIAVYPNLKSAYYNI